MKQRSYKFISACSDKPVSEMKIADPVRPMTRMYAKVGEEDRMSDEAAIRRINKQLFDPEASSPFICDLCSVAFLTKRELQLHLMCHGIHVAGNLGEEKVRAVNFNVPVPAAETSEGNMILCYEAKIRVDDNGNSSLGFYCQLSSTLIGYHQVTTTSDSILSADSI